MFYRNMGYQSWKLITKINLKKGNQVSYSFTGHSHMQKTGMDAGDQVNEWKTDGLTVLWIALIFWLNSR